MAMLGRDSCHHHEVSSVALTNYLAVVLNGDVVAGHC